MALKLEKTFLSRKLRHEAFLMAAASFLLLLLMFSLYPDSFVANGTLVFEKHEYWRIFTSALLHADLNHLAHNAFFFTGFAFLLNSYFGVMIFPILSLVAGGLINLITLYFYPPEVHLLGISGVVFFMAAFWFTSFILIDRRRSITKRFIYAIGMALIFFFPESFQPQTSYMAHATGFMLGIPAALIYFQMNKNRIRSAEVWVDKPEVVIDFDWEGDGDLVP